MKRRASQTAVSEQVTKLTDMTLAELRTEWIERYGAPPKHRAPEMLRRVLAWRIQADAFGGLDAPTVKLLSNERAPFLVVEQPGTRLARDYAGIRHEVLVVEGGAVYNNKQYGSLSEVARVITGQRWNGPRFFGLRREIQL
jgi:hypothetical protein